MEQVKGIQKVFRVFCDKEAYFIDPGKKQSNRLILYQIVVICAFAFVYGIVMGSFHSPLQSLSSGVKVVALFLSTLLICFPSFYIVQLILGSRMNLQQMITILLAGFVMVSAVALSFAPIVVFFLLTGDNYHFLQLLHVGIFIFSGFFGMKFIVQALKYACDKKGIYPQTGVTVFRIWIVILAFVGIQLAWNLRPFLGDSGEGFKLFRKYEGNFYTAIIYSFEQLGNKDNTNSDKKPNSQPDQHTGNGTATDTLDTLDIQKLLEN
jgi:hypothetical protein